MKKVKYFPKTIGTPENNNFFEGAIISMVICVPFWVFIFKLVF